MNPDQERDSFSSLETCYSNLSFGIVAAEVSCCSANIILALMTVQGGTTATKLCCWVWIG